MLSEKDKKELKDKIKANQHEVFVVSMEEMDAIVRSSPKGKLPHIQRAWQKIKGKAEVGANYTASATDAVTLSKLIGDLGGVSAKAYVKTYGGKPHIILKGRPGLRKILTGTKYGIKNPKVITMGLGKAGAINAAKSGGILTVVLLSAYRVADYILTDQATLSQLIGTLATDVVKVGIATGASIAVATALTSAGVVLAIGPLVAVIIVGVLASVALNALDNHYGITDKLISALDEIGDNIDSRIENRKQQIKNTVNETAESVIDYMIDSAQRLVINIVRHQIDKFLSTKPRLY